ncbi:MAG TPA: hypothetical protein P5107_04890 [Thermotogota bacterium]|nr:hypothetical protein [Thermotogota bacterium]HRW34380.1 hypothetical protein [Thermotogota bacterium]
MNTGNDIGEIEKGVQAYKQIKAKSDHVLKTRLKSRIRTMVGMSTITRGEGFKQSVDQLAEEDWKVGWARLYDFSFNDDFSEWLTKIGLDLFIVTANKKERETAFKLLNGIYLNALTNYVKQVIHNYYQDKMALHQKSREIAEKTIYKLLVNLDSYNPYKAGFLTWMFNIARNTALTPDKKTQENTEYSLDYDDDESIEQDKSDYLKSDDPSPDEAFAKEEMGRVILKALFDDSGYPWQILCVGLMKLGYKPGDIIEHFSDKSLGDIFTLFRAEFCASSFRSQEELDQLFKGMEEQLKKALKEVILSRDSKTKQMLEDHLEDPCESIRLKAFFGNNPNKNISDWNARNLTKLRKELKERGMI